MSNHKDYELFVRKTDPKHTKRVKGFGTPDFTNINTYYIIQELTKTFGLYNKEWGIKDIEWEHITIKDTIVVKAIATFFIGEVETKITHSDKFFYTSSKGREVIDTDIYKKVETNLIAKWASRLGFGTDIYMQEFESIDYTNEVLEETQLCNHETLAYLRKELQENGVNADVVTKHFMIRALKDLPYKNFNEAVAIIKAHGKNKQ